MEDSVFPSIANPAASEQPSAPPIKKPGRRSITPRPPLTQEEHEAGLELCKILGINPDNLPEERVREISKIWE
jgi:hypothetical protein